MNLEFKWDKPLPKIVSDLGFGRQLNLFAANESRRLMNPFVPMGGSTELSTQVETYSDNTAGYNHYTSIYAHYQFTGLLMLAPNGSAWARFGEIKHYAEPKTALNYNTEKNALATSHWDDAMIIAHGEKLVKAVAAYRKRLAK